MNLMASNEYCQLQNQWNVTSEIIKTHFCLLPILIDLMKQAAML